MYLVEDAAHGARTWAATLFAGQHHQCLAQQPLGLEVWPGSGLQPRQQARERSVAVAPPVVVVAAVCAAELAAQDHQRLVLDVLHHGPHRLALRRWVVLHHVSAGLPDCRTHRTPDLVGTWTWWTWWTWRPGSAVTLAPLFTSP